MKRLQLSYPAEVTFNDREGYYQVLFRDLPDAHGLGPSEFEALLVARIILSTVLQKKHEKKQSIPVASDPEEFEINIPVSPEVAIPILLRQLREKNKYTYADIARIMDVNYQTYQRIEAGRGNITLKTLEKVAKALGAMVQVELVSPNSPSYYSRAGTLVNEFKKQLLQANPDKIVEAIDKQVSNIVFKKTSNVADQESEEAGSQQYDVIISDLDKEIE